MENRVRELRLERGMNQTELALKINVSQQTISRIENGLNTFPADTLIHIAKFFHVSTDYILRLSDTRMTEEYRIEVQTHMEQHMNICRSYEKLSRRNQELVYELMEQLGNTEKDKYLSAKKMGNT
ncbi:MAG TPA: helix-turn-helix domain-containing protein [Candidatus Mediterraneibacter cottocaccae]|nr:helix-turn-helix domain-containing protein [Candidatus Mediterraneibacter cottocaccae]